MRQEEKEGRIELAEGLSKGRSQMCDYSLHSIKSRPAKIGDKLTVRDFGRVLEDLQHRKMRLWQSAFCQELS